MIISDIILVFLAAFCNAVMDKTDHHFSISIFSKIKSKKWRMWFNENESWRNKYVDRDPSNGRVKWEIFGIKFNKPVQLTDAWHFFKMWMIFFICLIPASHFFYNEPITYFGIESSITNMLIHFSVLGNVWNITFFRIFYSKLLNK
jgi:hypothetical protein